jgi:hypothetical protein
MGRLSRSRLGCLCLCIAAFGCDSKNEGSLTEKKLAEARAKASAASAEKSEKAAPATAAPPVKLDAFWDSEAYVRIAHDQKCPDGMDALFSGGAGAEKLRSSTFVAVLRGPSQVKLGEYQPAAGEFPVEVQGVVFCRAPDGKLISFALSDGAKPYVPGGREVGEFYWQAPPLTYGVKVPFAESKAFREKNMLGMDARVVFQPGKTQVHKKVERSTESAEEAAERAKFGIPKTAGNMEDWGAGRLLQAKVQGVRVGADGSRTELVVKKK